MKRQIVVRGRMLAMALMASLAMAWLVGASAAMAAEDEPGAVYTLSNSASGNQVIQFHRAADGTLTPGGSFPTGGLGSGSGLGSQGALVLSQNGRWLFAVNAGSDSVSVFAVRPGGLTLVDTAASGGQEPVSLTNHGDLLYVLNAGGSGNITGFRIGHNGTLSPIPQATQALSNHGAGSAPGPAQVSFGPNGRFLVVTEKATNLVDVYPVDRHGAATGPVTHPATGVTPYGFDFTGYDTLIVAEAFGGAPLASAVSSYHVSADAFGVVSPSVPTSQTAACWLVVTGNGKYAYTTNAGSSSVSSYRVRSDGSLVLLNARSGETGAGSAPIDVALSHNSQYLYVLSAQTGTLSAFRVEADGSLHALPSMGGLPLSSGGLEAR